jgi:PAS domain S-box-containing protein
VYLAKDIKGFIVKHTTIDRPSKGTQDSTVSTGEPVALQDRRSGGMQYRALLESAPDAIVVVNQAGTIVLVNEQVERLFGYRRLELIGHPAEMLVSEHSRVQHRAHHARFQGASLERPALLGHELFGLRKDGTEFPAEIRLSPLDTKQGMLVSSAIRDVSVRRRTEEDLRRLASIVEFSDDAIIGKTLDGIITSWNAGAERIYGYRASEAIGKSITMLVPAGRPSEIPAIMERSKAGKTTRHFMTRRITKDGDEVQIELTMSPIRDALDNVVGASAVGRDVTKYKKTESDLLGKVEELKHCNDDFAQFAHLASIELQEPLQAVTDFVEHLAARYQGKLDSDADKQIALALAGTERMQRLIGNLTVLTRTGTTGSDLSDTSSEDAWQQAIEDLAVAIEKSGAVLTHDPLPDVVADNMQLVRLFHNLIENAIQYKSLETPVIHISAIKNGKERWKFSVTDNGTGMDPQKLETISRMFRRLDLHQGSGTGMGLSVCKRIVERHGGNMSVESTPGHGSTFRFDLAGSKRQF